MLLFHLYFGFLFKMFVFHCFICDAIEIMVSGHLWSVWWVHGIFWWRERDVFVVLSSSSCHVLQVYLMYVCLCVSLRRSSSWARGDGHAAQRPQRTAAFPEPPPGPVEPVQILQHRAEAQQAGRALQTRQHSTGTHTTSSSPVGGVILLCMYMYLFNSHLLVKLRIKDGTTPLMFFLYFPSWFFSLCSGQHPADESPGLPHSVSHPISLRQRQQRLSRPGTTTPHFTVPPARRTSSRYKWRREKV